MDARPATSCHGWFKADCPMADLETGFTLEHSCIARERHPCTYFSLIGYQGAKSGGYGGKFNLQSRLWSRPEILLVLPLELTQLIKSFELGSDFIDSRAIAGNHIICFIVYES